MTLPTYRPTTPTTLIQPISRHEAAEAYARARPDLDALRPEEVGRITANIAVVLSIVLGALVHLEALMPIIATLPLLDLATLRKLRDYVYTLYYVDLMALLAAEGAADVPTLLAEATPMRERMLSVAEGMAKYGLVDAERVAAIRSGLGHLDTARDLGALAELFGGLPPEHQARLPVPAAEVDRAAELSLQLLAALGRRHVGSDGAGLPTRYDDDKARAFRLVVRTYDLGRRAVSYVRWHEGDADLLVPSLFSGKRRRSPAADEPGPDGAPTAPPAPEGEGDPGV
ncbi:MAG TPA: hypothetical protein VFS43_36995 [Polyangiaceae bacterium]|nr:hypothetical protein [Polyangiaceae bacterium]